MVCHSGGGSSCNDRCMTKTHSCPSRYEGRQLICKNWKLCIDSASEGFWGVLGSRFVAAGDPCRGAWGSLWIPGGYLALLGGVSCGPLRMVKLCKACFLELQGSNAPFVGVARVDFFDAVHALRSQGRVLVWSLGAQGLGGIQGRPVALQGWCQESPGGLSEMVPPPGDSRKGALKL